MSGPRLHLTEVVKREVRQRCHYGCVICGKPLYHYDHIREYHEVEEHNPDNITLLCASHHDSKTRGHIALSCVEKWNRNPVNGRSGSTAAHKISFDSSRVDVEIGGNRILIGPSGAVALRIDGDDLIRFDLRDGVLLPSIKLNDRDGRPILEVDGYELIHATRPWDCTFIGTTLEMREAPGDFSLSISLEPNKGRVRVARAFLSHNGVDVFVGARGIWILNNTSFIGSSHFQVPGVAIALGEEPTPGAICGISMQIARQPYDRGAAMAYIKQQERGWARGVGHLMRRSSE